MRLCQVAASPDLSVVWKKSTKHHDRRRYEPFAAVIHYIISAASNVKYARRPSSCLR